MSRSMSSKSIGPRTFNLEREDASFSVFTNTSKESFREYTMSLFIKQLLKRKTECEKINSSFEKSSIFDIMFAFTMHIMDNLLNEHQMLLEVIFDLTVKLQNLENLQFKFFCKDFFKKLIELVQNDQPQLSEEVSIRLSEYVYEILNHELFNKPDCLAVIEDILTRLVNTIINSECHSSDAFPLLHKIIDIYIKINVN